MSNVKSTTSKNVHGTFCTLSITRLTCSINWYAVCMTVANTRCAINQHILCSQTTKDSFIRQTPQQYNNVMQTTWLA